MSLTENDRKRLLEEQTEEWAKLHVEYEVKSRVSAEAAVDASWVPGFRLAKKNDALNLSWQGFERVDRRLFEFTNLTELRLTGHKLKAVPTGVGKHLRKLRVLSFSCNQISIVPANIGRLTCLQELNLMKNRIESLPRSVCKLSGLTSLSLAINRLSELPDRFGVFSGLEKLVLEQNQLSTLPESFANLKLKSLNLSHNRFGRVPPALFGLSTLEHLFINHNSVTFLPSQLCDRLWNLQELSLCGNRISSIPEEICRLKKLTSLWLDWNSISELPLQISLSPKLSDLKMEGNPLRQPQPEVVYAGMDAIRDWAKMSNQQIAAWRQRVICEQLQQILGEIGRLELAPLWCFEPSFPVCSNGVTQVYFAFLMDALFDEILPKYREWWESERQGVELPFDATKQEVVDAITSYRDPYGPIGRMGVKCCFKRCNCRDSFGRRAVCIPPKPGFQCERVACVLKMRAISQLEHRLLETKRREEEVCDRAMFNAKIRCEEHFRTVEAKRHFTVEGFKLAQQEALLLHRKRQEQLVYDKLKVEYDRRHAARDAKKQRLISTRDTKLATLKDKMEALMERRRAARDMWRKTQLRNEIEQLEDQMACLPEDNQIQLLVQEEEDEADIQDEVTRILAKKYSPPGRVNMFFRGLFSSKFHESVSKHSKILEREHLREKVLAAKDQVQLEYELLRRIMTNWIGVSERMVFLAWKDWYKERKLKREKDAKAAFAAAKLKQDNDWAGQQLAELELRKWKPKVDPFTDKVYYEHCETGETQWQRPKLEEVNFVYRGE